MSSLNRERVKASGQAIQRGRQTKLALNFIQYLIGLYIMVYQHIYIQPLTF